MKTAQRKNCMTVFVAVFLLLIPGYVTSGHKGPDADGSMDGDYRAVLLVDGRADSVVRLCIRKGRVSGVVVLRRERPGSMPVEGIFLGNGCLEFQTGDGETLKGRGRMDFSGAMQGTYTLGGKEDVFFGFSEMLEQEKQDRASGNTSYDLVFNVGRLWRGTMKDVAIKNGRFFGSYDDLGAGDTLFEGVITKTGKVSLVIPLEGGGHAKTGEGHIDSQGDISGVF